MRIEVFNMDMDDNPYLTEKAKKNYLDRLTPDEREARKSGKWMHLAGLIYKDWDRDVHVVNRSIIQDFWPRGLVVDPHKRKPYALGWFAVDPTGDMYFYDEWPNRPFHDIKSHANKIEEYVDLIKEKEMSHGNIELRWRILDPNFGRTPNPTTGMTLEDEFGEHGLHFDTEVSDDIDMGHQEVMRRLTYDKDEEISSNNSPALYITENCYNLKFGMEHYQWDEWRGLQETKSLKEKPKDKFKDYPDIVRYACMYAPSFDDTCGIVDNMSEDMGKSGYGI